MQKDQQFSRYGRNSHIWLNEPSLWPWTWRQQTNVLAWHFGPWCCITIPSLVTEGSTAEEISSRWTVTRIFNLSVTLTLNTTIQLLNTTLWLAIMYYQTKFGSKRISSSKDTVVCMTLWLIMMHHITKFGNKIFGGLEGIIQTNINILTFFFTGHSSFWWCIIRQSLVAKESTVQLI